RFEIAGPHVPFAEGAQQLSRPRGLREHGTDGGFADRRTECPPRLEQNLARRFAGLLSESLDRGGLQPLRRLWRKEFGQHVTGDLLRSVREQTNRGDALGIRAIAGSGGFSRLRKCFADRL